MHTEWLRSMTRAVCNVRLEPRSASTCATATGAGPQTTQCPGESSCSATQSLRDYGPAGAAQHSRKRVPPPSAPRHTTAPRTAARSHRRARAACAAAAVARGGRAGQHVRRRALPRAAPAPAWPAARVRCATALLPNRPIFFYLGNEADVLLYLNNTGLMWESAPEFDALLVFAEHRCRGPLLCGFDAADAPPGASLSGGTSYPAGQRRSPYGRTVAGTTASRCRTARRYASTWATSWPSRCVTRRAARTRVVRKASIHIVGGLVPDGAASSVAQSPGSSPRGSHARLPHGPCCASHPLPLATASHLSPRTCRLRLLIQAVSTHPPAHARGRPWRTTRSSLRSSRPSCEPPRRP
jgi:hypothetical protein